MESNDKQVDFIQAAGGLVCRNGSGGKEILVIHRKRYDDWTLPKGKLMPGETLMEAALREVREETGYLAQIIDFAGTITYKVNEKPKVVSFWHMKPLGRPGKLDGGEVEKAYWMSFDKAYECLQYPVEKAFLNGWRASIKLAEAGKRKKLWFPSTYYKRLARIKVFLFHEHYFLNSLVLKKQNGIEHNSFGDWDTRSGTLLMNLSQALIDNNTDLGWTYAKEAARYHLYGMAQIDPKMFHARTNSILKEGKKKLSGWRLDLFLDLIAKGGKPNNELSIEEVIEAARILDGHNENFHDRLEMLRSRIMFFSILALAVLTIWWSVSPMFQISTEVSKSLQSSPGNYLPPIERILWAIISLFGIMGAILSAFISLARNLRIARVPDYLAEGWVTLARLAIAALTANLAVILLFSRFLNLNTNSSDSSGIILVVALAAGFSERLIIRSIENITTFDKATSEIPTGG